MTEYLDYYDIDGNFLGKETREYIHANGLWHNTVHCRLYTENGDIIFQIRADTHTLYTTASGHVLSGETIKQAFSREVKEELGIDIDTTNAKLISINPRKLDKQKNDGTVYKDRAKAHVYINLYEGNFSDFNFDPKEIEGIAVVNAKDALNLFTKGNGSIPATLITNQGVTKENIDISRFLVTENETYLGKYGDILEKIISSCQ